MPLRSFILENLALKLVSLFLATLIWFAIQSSQTENRFSGTIFPARLQILELRCPVTVMTPPSSRSGFWLEPSSVVVKVRGDDATLKKLSPESIEAYVRPVDFPNLSRLFPVEVVVPRNVTLKEIIPEQVLVRSSPGDK